ncbi:hypothetical protein SAMN04488122_4383 [Chitinophaga arvensicola]|uniref:Uncharacterized protein n=1 Tax=Chitinophaga arvensicola TaxID=29529 RepID=A0A1I0S7B3_9BACT|nr:hypothetical protein SAMN04488122_4383 [Chitinophaga arvensicola]
MSCARIGLHPKCEPILAQDTFGRAGIVYLLRLPGNRSRQILSSLSGQRLAAGWQNADHRLAGRRAQMDSQHSPTQTRSS